MSIKKLVSNPRDVVRKILAIPAVLLYCLFGWLDSLCCNEDCPEDES